MAGGAGQMSQRPSPSLLSALAAALPLLAAGVASSAQAEPPVVFAPPSAPMLLTRTLRRSLSDGREVISRRRYELHFLRDGDGFRVEGRLIDSSVEAPPVLHALAEIERTRPDSGLFPMRLDATGLIIPEASAPSAEARRQAASQAAAQIRGSAMSSAQKETALGSLGQFAAQGAQTPVPLDLFRPAPGRHVESREVAMPDGGQGLITIEIDATPSTRGPLLATLDHTITTALGTDRRVVTEQWALLPEP